MWTTPMSVVKCPHGAEYRGFDVDKAVEVIRTLCEKCGQLPPTAPKWRKPT